MKKAWRGYLLIAPLMAGVLLFYAVPFAMTIRYSLQNRIGKNSTFVGLENYRSMFSNGMFRLAAFNTLRFLVIGLPLILVLSYAIALVLQKYARRFKLLKSVLLLPYIMPVVGTVTLVELLFANTGTLNKILSALGIPVTNWLESSGAFGVVLLLYLWKNTGYSVILLLAGLVTIPKEQYTAADLDGAGGIQKFLYITTPQMWYSVFFALLFSLINAFKCFREILLIGGNHPNVKIYMLQHFINNSFENLNYARLSVASVLLFLVIVLVVGIAYILIQRKERYKA
jgi:multiple sugar transport system permease protein